MSAKSYSVFSTSELATLRQKVASAGDEPSALQQDRQELRKLSNERAKTWGNTIENLRTKKEQDRKQRLDDEERAKQVIDAEEAAYQAEVRRKAIERANRLIYEDDDRVKKFNSKLLLADVFQERELQMDITKQKKDFEKRQDAKWHDVMIRQLTAAEIEEERKAEDAKKQSHEVKKMLSEQLDIVRIRKDAEREEQIREGEKMNKHILKVAEEEMARENKKKEQARETAKGYHEANLSLKSYKQSEQQKIKEEEERIQKFAEIKENQMSQRKSREEQRFKEKMEIRQKMIDAQAAKLAALNDQFNARVDSQVAEAEAKAEADEIAKEEKAQRLLASIDHSRQMQLKIKEHHKLANDAENRLLAQQSRMRLQQLALEEEANRIRQALRDRQLLADQKGQMAEKRQKEAQEKELARIEGELMKQSIAQEEEMFKSYVAMTLKEYTAQGKPMHVLKSEYGSVGRRAGSS